MASTQPGTRGFKRTSQLLKDRIRRASESRGFAVSRLLTQWEEVAGPDIASIARPVDVSYGRQGFGATLTVLTTGAQAPMLEMQKEKLRERVNAVYGYNAISRIRLTQTAPTGFAEGKASFEHRPKQAPAKKPDPATQAEAAQMAAPVGDGNLREALEALGQNVLSKSKR
ncbi:MAG: DciA family protein [Roseovarius sp.]|nr:DciA family protein [Roseovarius sp.]